ncbi:MAG: hypothetical protein V4591_07530 [Bdellovibrionota bacterium]
MPFDTVDRIMSSIKRQWNVMESFLYYPTKLPEFSDFLNNYRGVPKASANFTTKKHELAESTALGVMNFFINIFSLEGLADLDCKNIEITLCEIEKNVNLALYYWFGLNDRNYQFRTWIHFFGLEGLSCVFLTKDKQDYSVTLLANGICFGAPTDLLLPKITPVSKIFISDVQQEADIFTRLREMQREICLFVDEWEYQNSILAVEYGQSLKLIQQDKTNFVQESHKKLLVKLDIHRNYLACFCLESLCDFQEWVHGICKNNLNNDLIAEVDALCALMLSALQKFFLPASISRLVYRKEVVLLFRRFIQARLDYCPEDYSAQLVLQALKSAQGEDFNSNLLHILKSKPFEWKLCFDPSPAIKAFCWAYGRKHHVLLSTLMGLCFFKKCYSNKIEDFQLSDIVSTYQTQNAFMNHLRIDELPENPIHISESECQNLTTSFLNYLSTHIKPSKQNEECVDIIKHYLDLL